MLVRFGVSLAYVVVIFTGCSERTPSSKNEHAAHVPTTLGDKWVVADISIEGLPIERNLEVTGVERKDDALVVTITRVTRQDARTERRDVIKVSEAGEFLIDEGKTHYDEPIRLMMFPLKEGDTWEWEKPGLQKWRFKVLQEEEVEVPAGKFKALRIEGEGTIQEPNIKAVRSGKWTEWIAPGYPTIKSIIRIGDGSEICDGEQIEVLKSFTPANK
jgi:hypothetical protein